MELYPGQMLPPSYNEYDDFGKVYYVYLDWFKWFRSLFPTQERFSLNDPLKHLHNRIEYVSWLVHCDVVRANITSASESTIDFFGKICTADTMYLEFEKNPTKQKELLLLQFFRTNLVLLGPDVKMFFQRNSIQKVRKHFKYCEKTFVKMLKTVTRQLIDAYLGLLPLKLDVWTVLFIVNQMPEFDTLTDAKKVRIYERMRLFKEEKLKPKVLVIRDKLNE